MTEPLVWTGDYNFHWSGFITKESFAHPAKFSRGLIEHIFDHMLARGWIAPGQTVADPFGGVATGGVIAAYRGLEWCGVELEPRFVNLGRANINLHRQKLEHLGRPIPQLIQGDSRQFDKILGGTGAVVTLPPYAGSVHSGNGIDQAKLTGNVSGANSQAFSEGYGETAGQIAALREGDVSAVITSPPWEQNSEGAVRASKFNYVLSYTKGHGSTPAARQRQMERDEQKIYGTSPGQIGQLSGGSVDACITSPPYAAIAAGAGGLNTKPAKHPGQQSGRTATLESQNTDQRYGQSTGQISRLKQGAVDSVVTSPPYAETSGKGGGGINVKGYVPADGRKWTGDKPDPVGARTYQGQGGERTEGNIETCSTETYWQAMRDVYAACFRALKPGGYMAVVVKDYVKAKQRVRLCDDTLRLLEHCGFVPVERAQAMLTTQTRENDLFAGHTVTTRSRKSFFRRLAESKGSPPIDFEEVLFVRKPLAEAP